jgi:hypothetical protein
MANPTVRVLGAYPVPFTDELFAAAMDMKYGGLELSRREQEAAEQAIRAELASIALIEAEVSDVDSEFDVTDFTQPDSDQVPYDEAYLSADGARVLTRGFDVPKERVLRLAFFLHFFDWALPLCTSYGEVPVPPPATMPSRLAALMPYEPMD